MNNWGQLAVFDLETTGVDVDTARIVSACIAVLAADGSVTARWDWMADPGIEIPEGATAVHGISTERARRDGRPAHVVVAEITQTLRVLFGIGIPVVVYNAPYDLTLLDRECRRHQQEPIASCSPVIDPLVIDKALDRYRKGKRTLEATAALFEVALDDAHDAGSDAIAAGRVAQALGRSYPDDLDISLADLHGRQEVWYSEQAASFQAYIRSVKGDEEYVADTAWPVRPAESASSLLDTQPVPAPAPRPSLTVPVYDLYGTGVISLGSLQLALPTGSALYLEADGVDDSPVIFTPDPVVETADENDNNTMTPDDGAPVEQSGAPDASAPDDDERAAEVDAIVVVHREGSLASALGSPADHGRPVRATVLRVAAGILIDAEGRTLLVRKRGTTAFMQAGGKIEEGESAVDALARELREEIGLELDPDHTEYLGSHRAIAANEPDTVIRAEVFALAISPESAAAVKAGGEIAEVRWLSQDEAAEIELAPLTRDTILPLWVERRSAHF